MAHDHQTTIDHAADIETVSNDALDAMLARLELAAAAVRALPNPSADDQDLSVLAARVRIEHRKRQARRAILGAGKAA